MEVIIEIIGAILEALCVSDFDFGNKKNKQ